MLVYKIVIFKQCESLAEARELASYSESIGVDGICAMSTVFFKPKSVTVLINSMKYIAAVLYIYKQGAPNTPFLYYHVPAMFDLGLDVPDFFTEAYENIPTFAGIKFTDAKLHIATEIQHRIDEYVKQGKKRVSLLFGVDEQFDTSVFMGLDGGVGSTYGYAGKLYNNIIKAYNNDDHGIIYFNYRCCKIISIQISSICQNICKICIK